MRRVLFVCTGNTCRSPMAEALFRHILRERGAEDRVSVSSAGLAAALGAPAAGGAERALAARGVTLVNHRARPLEREAVEAADLILAMTKAHRDELRRRFPEKGEVILTLKEYVGYSDEDLDVDDPFGADDEQYRRTADEIARLVEQAVERFLEAGEP